MRADASGSDGRPRGLPSLRKLGFEFRAPLGCGPLALVQDELM